MPDAGGRNLEEDQAHYELASAATLAEQAVEDTAKRRPAREAPYWSTLFSHLEARLGGLRTWRYSWWTYWAKLAEFILPRRYKWLVTANTMDRGFPINQAIIDGTPTWAMQICAAGLLSGLMSPSRPWAVLEGSVPNFKPDHEAKIWLQDSSERLFTVLKQSNFYKQMAQFFQDVATFGTAVIIIYEDFEDVIRCYVPCAGEYYLAASARLTIDTMYREYTYTVSQLVEWFGIEGCPPQVQQAWQTGGSSLEMEFVVAHSIEPNFALSNRSGGTVDPLSGDFTYREVYWLKGIKTDKPLSLRGFREKPFMVGRWSTVANDAYGRGPGMDALGDSMQLQQETRRKGEFIEKLVRPPMGADPQLKNEPASISPGHVTYVTSDGAGKKGFWPLFEVAPQALAPMVADIEKISARVEKFFCVDVFQMISRMEGVQPRNELELTLRRGEQIQRLGPMIEDHETEVAAPEIYRVLNIMERRGLLKPRPKSLEDMPLKVKYVSVLKLAQLAVDTTSMEQGIAFGGRVTAAAQAAGKPDPMRIINLDEVYRTYLDRVSFPAIAVRSEEEVDAADQALAKQAQGAALMQATMAGVSAAKTLSETDVGGGQNALTALTARR